MNFKSRKEARKELRKQKKVKKHEFFLKKRNKQHVGGSEKVDQKKEQSLKGEKGNRKNKKEKKVREFNNPYERVEFERKQEKKERDLLEKQIRQQKIKQLEADNLREEQEIRKLEKQLKIKKRKSNQFAADGLDYLLDICDKKISENEFENTFNESDSEFESDLDNIVGTTKEKKTNKKKKNKKTEEESEDEESESELDDFEEDEIDDIESEEIEGTKPSKKRPAEKPSKKSGKKVRFEKEDSESEDEFEEDYMEEEEEKPNIKSGKKVKFEDEDLSVDEEEEDLSGEEEEEDENDEEEEDEKRKKKPKVWEDIYGRTRDDKGNVISTYTPPHLRQKAETSTGDKNTEKLLRLKKQLKGLLNRLAESNMTFISNQIEQLYMSNSRNDMNETLCSLFTESLMTEVLTPERLITEHAMLIAVLHSNIGSEIGAHFLQYAVMEFNKLLESGSPVEDKRINNVLLFIMHLYNFQIFHSKLMYDIVNELLKNLEEKQIELLLTTFRTVGFNLRKDDPVALKALVIKVQEKVNASKAEDTSSRVKFMLEMLMAIKNNNMSKIPNYNPEFVEKLRKSLKMIVRKGNYSTELNISLQDLLNADKHGRWWIVGSAWSGSAPSQPTSKEEESAPTEFSQKLLELAKKQRMNTDVRRSIFCILMSAEDFLDAFEKLLKLKLKGVVEREIMNVLIHCALQEKTFNPYYVYLANKFCSFDRKYQIMLQYALWDKIKEIKNAMPSQVTNLAKFVGKIILEKGLPISILKVIEFSELDKPTTKFMRQVLLAILLSEDENSIAAVFRRIADSSKLKLFRESLRLFLQHFVLKNTKKVEEEKVSRLVDMVKVAEKALESSDGLMVF